MTVLWAALIVIGLAMIAFALWPNMFRSSTRRGERAGDGGRRAADDRGDDQR